MITVQLYNEKCIVFSDYNTTPLSALLYSREKKMKSVQLVVVATVFTFPLMEMGASQCDGEKC